MLLCFGFIVKRCGYYQVQDLKRHDFEKLVLRRFVFKKLVLYQDLWKSLFLNAFDWIFSLFYVFNFEDFFFANRYLLWIKLPLGTRGKASHEKNLTGLSMSLWWRKCIFIAELIPEIRARNQNLMLIVGKDLKNWEINQTRPCPSHFRNQKHLFPKFQFIFAANTENRPKVITSTRQIYDKIVNKHVI